jgi:DNA-binding CsgD family transcriptional regulator/tetratricopeptide (TPR) repeat protein
LHRQRLKETDTGLVGRERECGKIDQLLRSARRGEGGSLVLFGEPGIGKTALLGYAAQRAGAATILRTAGVDGESDLAFAGLHGLLLPVTGVLDQLPEAQRRALAGALGLAAPPRSDRLLVCAATLALIAASADDRPVVCLVDDAQWLDEPSAGALVFAARRLRAERAAMLFAARDGQPCRFRAKGLPELPVDGLAAAAAASLLGTAAPRASPAIRDRLLAEAAGNPLALLELPGALTAAQLAGRDLLPEPIQLTPRLHNVFQERTAGLPGPARLALLLAAADNTGDLLTVLRAAALLQIPADALDPAENAGLVQTRSGQIIFRHPLVRSVIYQEAPLSQRQRAHAALADALPGVHEADRRAWHQALAASTSDEPVAAALEALAERARQRAGHASAATAFERAAALTRDSPRLGRRLAAAAQAAWDAGQAERARALIARALPWADGHVRARLLYLRGVIEQSCGSLDQAVITQLEGARIADDPSLTLKMLYVAAEGAIDTGDLTRLRDIGRMASETTAPTSRDRLGRAVVTGLAALFTGEHEQAHAAFDTAVALAGEFADDPHAQIWAVNAAWLADDTGASLRFATRAVDLARQQGLLSLLPAALNQQAMELLRNSSFSRAYAAAEEGYLLSVDLGHGEGWHLSTMACVEAIWGHEADARRHSEQVLAVAHARGDMVLSVVAHATLGLLALTAGRPAEAASVLLAISPPGWLELPPIAAVASVPEADAIEAIQRAGQPRELAEAPLARIRAWAKLLPNPARRSVLARCEALLGARPPDQAFAEALGLAHAISPFERARTELLYGEWLRRDRKRAQARTHLRTAAELFRSFGTGSWAQRAEAELRACGETTHGHTPPPLDLLTPQENKIAELVTRGLTNRDIAAQLFLSPRTIDYHLRKVFTKLGIASRAELIRHGTPRPDPR